VPAWRPAPRSATPSWARTPRTRPRPRWPRPRPCAPGVTAPGRATRTTRWTAVRARRAGACGSRTRAWPGPRGAPGWRARASAGPERGEGCSCLGHGEIENARYIVRCIVSIHRRRIKAIGVGWPPNLVAVDPRWCRRPARPGEAVTRRPPGRPRDAGAHAAEPGRRRRLDDGADVGRLRCPCVGGRLHSANRSTHISQMRGGAPTVPLGR
jgi:hypothetical protein